MTEDNSSSHVNPDGAVEESGQPLLGTDETSGAETQDLSTNDQESSQDDQANSSNDGALPHDDDGTEDGGDGTGDQPLFELPEQFKDDPDFEEVDSMDALLAKLTAKRAPESYTFPEGFDDSLATAISEQALAADMTQGQVEALIAFNTSQQTVAEAQMWDGINRGVESLKKEWGGDFDDNVNAANKAISTFDDSDGTIKGLMKENPLIGNHPAVVKLFQRIAAAIDTDSFIPSGGGDGGAPVDENGQRYFGSYDKTTK